MPAVSAASIPAFDGGVRVVTWNVQHAGVDRSLRQVAWLTGVGLPEVIVLTEVSAGVSGTLWAQELEKRGYGVILPVAADRDTYRVLVAARGVVERVEAGVTVLPHRCVAARVKADATVMGVVGLYVPSRGPRERRNVAKRAFQEEVSAALPGLVHRLAVDGPCVVAGDLNVVEPGHEPRYSVFGDWEYAFYESFAANGFADAFRVLHPVEMDYSWFGRPDTAGRRNGYRFDHVFVTACDAVTDCRYLHGARADKLSDHAAMTLTLAI
jgi:exodeoxyribonuclease-3